MIKQGLRKAVEGGHDTHLMLLSFRNTSLAGLPYSPAQLLMSRRLRDQLPCSDWVLEPQVPVDVRRLMVQQQQRAKHFYDQGAKELMPLLLGAAFVYSVRRPGNQRSLRLNTKNHIPPSSPLQRGKHVYRHLRSMDQAPSPDASPLEEFQQEETAGVFPARNTAAHTEVWCRHFCERLFSPI